MAAQRGRVRSRRSGPVVAVTGAAGPAGAAITAALVAAQSEPDGPAGVIAVDAVRGPVDGCTWRLGEVADPSVLEHLTGADVVVHVAAQADLDSALAVPALERRARTVRAVQAVATAAAAVGARHLIVVTSAMVHGAQSDNPVPLPDEAPLRASQDDGLVGDLLEVERIVERTPRVHPGLKVAVIRPAALVGPGVDTVVTRHFEAPRLLAVRGASTLWQFCHVADLGSAVALVVRAGLTGPLSVAGEGWLTDAEVERASGMRRVEVPQGLAFATAERLHRVGVLPTPSTDLAYVVHPWVVSAQRLREAGWTPEHGNQDCLEVLLSQVRGHHAVVGRRVERRDAALGAAGAAVALVGTAAILRQARARQSRRRRPTL